jgi:hypothetical protein
MKLTSRAVLIAAVVTIAAVALALGYRYVGTRSSVDFGALTSYYSQLPVPRSTTVDSKNVARAIEAAASYLRRQALPSGQFVYAVNMNPQVRVPQEYSLLRHAGTVYALGMAHSVHPDDATLDVMFRAVSFMRECCLARVEPGDMYGVWEPPHLALLAQKGRPPTFKLGGAGLALVAMSSLEALRPGSVPPTQLQGVARLGQFLQRKDGDFYGAYVPSERSKEPLTVLYYPGEMMLGWLWLYKRMPSPQLIEAAVAGLSFLAKDRAAEGIAPPDHWALLATATLFEMARRDGLSIPQDRLISHAIQICHRILEDGHRPPLLPAMEGTLVPRGGTTPNAVRMEGLIAALSFLPNDHPIRPHIEAAVHRGIDFLLRAQVKGGEFDGGMPQAIMTLPEDGSEEVAKFNREATEVRIDYVQHALSAFVQYLRWTSLDRAVSVQDGR